MVEFTTIKGPRLGLGGTGEIVVDGNRLDVTKVTSSGDIVNADVAADANIALSKLAEVAEITTVGGTTIEAGTIQEVLQAIADLADPAV